MKTGYYTLERADEIIKKCKPGLIGRIYHPVIGESAIIKGLKWEQHPEGYKIIVVSDSLYSNEFNTVLASEGWSTDFI